MKRSGCREAVEALWVTYIDVGEIRKNIFVEIFFQKISLFWMKTHPKVALHSIGRQMDFRTSIDLGFRPTGE